MNQQQYLTAFFNFNMLLRKTASQNCSGSNGSKSGMRKAIASDGASLDGCQFGHAGIFFNNKRLSKVLEQVMNCLPLISCIWYNFPPYVDFVATV